jgi:CubicO group peptidase (beta-lactamase class C family)
VAGLGLCHGETALSKRLQPHLDAKNMAGAVSLVADKNKTLLLETIGLADIANEKPMKEDTLFWIASMTKPMTGVAVMILVDEGKLSLDDPLEKFIPAFADIKVKDADGTLRPPARPPTLLDALSHRSGMGFINKTCKNLLDAYPLATSIEHNLLEPLRSDPGAKYSYSNMGIDTAGRVVEIVSGVPFETFMQTRVFDPLGMADTTFAPTPAQLARLAKSYAPAKEGVGLREVGIHFLRRPLGGDEPRYPNPGGGLFSTARDCAVFCQMLLNKGAFNGVRILSPEATREMIEKGVTIGPSKNATNYGHNGAFQTAMRVDNGIVTVFLVQYNTDWPRDLNPNPRDEFYAFVRETFLK